MSYWLSGSSPVDRAVASARGSWFETRHQFFIQNIYVMLTVQKTKRGRERSIFKKNKALINQLSTLRIVYDIHRLQADYNTGSFCERCLVRDLANSFLLDWRFCFCVYGPFLKKPDDRFFPRLAADKVRNFDLVRLQCFLNFSKGS